MNEMTPLYLAIDIGASSGRLISGQLLNNQIKLEEIHRFKNGFTQKDGHDRWEIDHLIDNIFYGLEQVKVAGIEKCVIGIDTWAVDYVLIDQVGDKLADPISYRDQRTVGAIEKLTESLSKQAIYQKTGIQFLELNTLYQLYTEDQALLDQADKLLLIPDYIGYVLTGQAVSERTNTSTTQMLNLASNTFDQELLEHLRVKADIFAPLTEAGTFLGELQVKWEQKYDLPQANVVTVATHDTASAVVGTPGQGENWAFLSSGTWSLLGMELSHSIPSEAAFSENYTNEAGAYGTNRFLKNIMGLWIIQEIARHVDGKYSFAEMAQEAEKYPPFAQFIDVNDQRFNRPKNMIKEIQNYCLETNQQVPETIGELTNCIYSNLALCYTVELDKLAQLTDRKIEQLHIVGGGSQVAYLNQLTANLANLTVYAGPSEATAIGNLVIQMISQKDIANLNEARKIISQSSDIDEYVPEEGQWYTILEQYKTFLKLIK